MNYISPEGFEVLCDLRVGDPPPVTESVTPPVQLLACVPSEDCGCPEEIWRIHGIDVLIHLEEDGTGEMFVFAGDYEIEEKFDDTPTIEHLRAAMFTRIIEWMVPE